MLGRTLPLFCNESNHSTTSVPRRDGQSRELSLDAVVPGPGAQKQEAPHPSSPAATRALKSRRPPPEGRHQAACGADTAASTGWKRGYQVRNVSSHSPLSTCVRTWRSRWAPSGVHCICCFWTMCLLTTWLIADSVNALLEPLVSYPLCAPRAIGHRPRADQRDHLSGEGRARCRCGDPRRAAPLVATQVAMPGPHGLGLDDEQGRPPRPRATGQQHQPGTVGQRATRARDAGRQDDELLPQQGSLGDEDWLAAPYIGRRAADARAVLGFAAIKRRWRRVWMTARATSVRHYRRRVNMRNFSFKQQLVVVASAPVQRRAAILVYLTCCPPDAGASQPHISPHR